MDVACVVDMVMGPGDQSIDESGIEVDVESSDTSERTSNVALTFCALSRTESQGQWFPELRGRKGEIHSRDAVPSILS